MMKIANLTLISMTYTLIGTFMEATFFELYNSKYHPFNKILDISDDNEGTNPFCFDKIYVHNIWNNGT